MACSICNDFQGKWPIGSRHVRPQRKGSRSYYTPDFGFEWESLDRSARSCYGCRILLSGARNCFKLHDIEEAQVQSGYIHFDYPDSEEDLMKFGAAEKALIFGIETKQYQFEYFAIEIFVAEDGTSLVPNSWDHFHTSRRICHRSDSAHALTVVQQWLMKCVENHSKGLCRRSANPLLPSRVVDVGIQDGVVRLVESNGARGEYICLSHCWGHAQIITTTRATIDDRKRDIAWDQLSKTFQDAISMTRKLRFRYLWIDSLCIIQDDIQDWERESAQMATVYSNGYLTLAGTLSPDGNGGLFSAAPDVEITGISPLNEPYRLYFRKRIQHYVEIVPQGDDCPLLTRAWAFQERVLSTRVLHYGTQEMFFECKSSAQCECGVAYNSNSLYKVDVANELIRLRPLDSKICEQDYPLDFARMWHGLVATYTQLSLTKPEDRLPALEGLARQIAASRRSTYLAGLWDDTLQYDLLWQTNRARPEEFAKTRLARRLVPTWSWASVSTPISHLQCHGSGLGTKNTPSDKRMPVFHTKIESCNVALSTSPDSRQIAEGLLVISGLWATGLIESESFGKFVPFESGRWRMIEDYPLDSDGPDHVANMSQIHCLRMITVPRDGPDYLYSLVLRKSLRHVGCFERIGVVCVTLRREEQSAEIYSTAESRTVTIV